MCYAPFRGEKHEKNQAENLQHLSELRLHGWPGVAGLQKRPGHRPGADFLRRGGKPAGAVRGPRHPGGGGAGRGARSVCPDGPLVHPGHDGGPGPAVLSGRQQPVWTCPGPHRAVSGHAHDLLPDLLPPYRGPGLCEAGEQGKPLPGQQQRRRRTHLDHSPCPPRATSRGSISGPGATATGRRRPR